MPVLGLIRLYQFFISPLLGSSCRYYPSCSEYAIESFNRYFFIKALYRTAWRILRCNPFSKGGVDLP
ncbi:MAG: membrane protein insertion efficiency factor YidD [Candidatus Delongbacteria bacterium]|nr:membrane protein insertion efficiency factor YidD [bacterium]MBL7033692.1 membrane protein insertion efficiency factor YidD [Candidatus Delongbacteria bacterium]